MGNQIKERVKETVSEQINARVTDQASRAAGTVNTLADTLRSSSRQLSNDGQEGVSEYLERAASQAERLANYLETADVSEAIYRVERFARRQPAAFVAAAFGVGFLASRFLKSSPDDGYDAGYRGSYNTIATTDGYGTTGGYGTDAGYTTETPTTDYGTAGFDSPRASVGLETNSTSGNNSYGDGSSNRGV